MTTPSAFCDTTFEAWRTAVPANLSLDAGGDSGGESARWRAVALEP